MVNVMKGFEKSEDDYDSYADYLNDLLKTPIEDIPKELNTLSVFDNMRYSNSIRKKELITEVVANESEYRIEVLKKSLQDSDAEVVYYSASSLSYIEREFEERLQKKMMDYRNNKNIETVFALVQAYRHYIDSGLLEGSIKDIIIRECIKYQSELLVMNRSLDTLISYCELLVKAGRFEEAKEIAQEISDLDAGRKESYLMNMKIGFGLKDFEFIKVNALTLKTESFILSEEEEKIIVFWT
jgi:hypothetical protein